MSLDIFIVSVLPNALMHLCITGVDLLRERISIIRSLMSKSSIVGCLGCSLGQAPTSAKSDTDWIHFVTPRHCSDTVDRQSFVEVKRRQPARWKQRRRMQVFPAVLRDEILQE